MNNGIKFYKTKLISELLKYNQQVRSQLLDELVVNTNDPTVFKRRLRMLKHVNAYETQLLEKIQRFDTHNVEDFSKFDIATAMQNIIHRSA